MKYKKTLALIFSVVILTTLNAILPVWIMMLVSNIISLWLILTVAFYIINYGNISEVALINTTVDKDQNNQILKDKLSEFIQVVRNKDQCSKEVRDFIIDNSYIPEFRGLALGLLALMNSHLPHEKENCTSMSLARADRKIKAIKKSNESIN